MALHFLQDIGDYKRPYIIFLPFSLSQIHITKEVYEAKNIVNTFLFNGSPLVGTFKFVVMYKLKFLFEKELHINPNQNSTKAIRVICDDNFFFFFLNNTKKLNKKIINLN